MALQRFRDNTNICDNKNNNNSNNIKVCSFNFHFSNTTFYPQSERIRGVVMYVCEIHREHDSMPVNERTVTCSFQSAHIHRHA